MRILSLDEINSVVGRGDASACASAISTNSGTGGMIGGAIGGAIGFAAGPAATFTVPAGVMLGTAAGAGFAGYVTAAYNPVCL